MDDTFRFIPLPLIINRLATEDETYWDRRFLLAVPETKRSPASPVGPRVRKSKPALILGFTRIGIAPGMSLNCTVTLNLEVEW